MGSKGLMITSSPDAQRETSRRRHPIRQAVIVIIAAAGVSVLAAVIMIWFAGVKGRCCGPCSLGCLSRCWRR
jgi:hypothetical protein